MQTRTIGKNGFETSAIGYGAMSISGVYGDATDAETFRILDACHDFGITHLDTAQIYGNGRSERLIGEWFCSRGSAVRDKFTVATKAAFAFDPNTGKRSV